MPQSLGGKCEKAPVSRGAGPTKSGIFFLPENNHNGPKFCTLPKIARTFLLIVQSTYYGLGSEAHNRPLEKLINFEFSFGFPWFMMVNNCDRPQFKGGSIVICGVHFNWSHYTSGLIWQNFATLLDIRILKARNFSRPKRAFDKKNKTEYLRPYTNWESKYQLSLRGAIAQTSFSLKISNFKLRLYENLFL